MFTKIWVLLVGVLAPTICAQSVTPHESLELSCIDRPYVSVLAETKDRKSAPHIGLELVDPLGRTQGRQPAGASAMQLIPNSSYGDIVQLPGSSLPSLAHGVQVCDAEQGVFELRVREHGSKPYRLSVTAEAKTTDRVTLHLTHVSREGRARVYKFIFQIERDHFLLSWLDRDGKPQMRIEDGEW